MMDKKVNFGPIRKLLEDQDISEIMINGFDRIFVERNGIKVPEKSLFRSSDELDSFVDEVFRAHNKRIGPDYPCGDLCMEDGTRINAIISPLSRFGTAVTIRKFSENIKTMEDLIRLGMINQNAADFLIACVKAKINMIISGGTGVGKTTLLQILSRYFHADERVVTIEDAAELTIHQKNVVSLETHMPNENGKGEVTLRDLTRNALRMSPDRLIFGEIRGGEAFDILQSMSMGSLGAIGVVHGNIPEEAMSRLESMVLLLGLNMASADIRNMISNTIHLIIHVERVRNGQRRVTSLTELRGMKGGDIFYNPLYSLKAKADGKSDAELKSDFQYYPRFISKLEAAGLVTTKSCSRD